MCPPVLPPYCPHYRHVSPSTPTILSPVPPCVPQHSHILSPVPPCIPSIPTVLSPVSPCVPEYSHHTVPGARKWPLYPRELVPGPRDASAPSLISSRGPRADLSPDKQEISHTPSQAAPVKGRTQCLFDCDSDVEIAVAMTVFNTPSQASSDDQDTDEFSTPHSVVSSPLGSPHPFVTPSPLAVWRALGLEPMCDTCLPSGKKQALSPTFEPMYLRASALPDPEPQDSVERCLFDDSNECSTDASDTCKARKKRAKLNSRQPSR